MRVCICDGLGRREVESPCCIRGRWDHVDMTISFIATENKHSWFFVKWTQYLTVISHSPANMTCDLAHGGVVSAHGHVVRAHGGVVSAQGVWSFLPHQLTLHSLLLQLDPHVLHVFLYWIL